MPSFSKVRSRCSAVMPPPAGAVWPTDLAASSVRFSASGVDTSGLGAPFFTAMPMPVREMSMRGPTTLPSAISLSSSGLATRIMSANSPPRSLRASPPDGS